MSHVKAKQSPSKNSKTSLPPLEPLTVLMPDQYSPSELKRIQKKVLQDILYGKFLQSARKGLERVKAKFAAHYVQIIGQKYGRWEVIEVWGKEDSQTQKLLCVCECGQLGIIQTQHLFKGISKSCGCLREQLPRDKASGQIGKKYYQLEVIDHINIKGRYLLVCVCDCGNLVLCANAYLKGPRTQSCGCNFRDTSHDKASLKLRKLLDPNLFFFRSVEQNFIELEVLNNAESKKNTNKGIRWLGRYEYYRGNYAQLIGNKYYQWEVIEYWGHEHRTHKLLCVCECGQLGIVATADLLRGNHKSCSCSTRGPLETRCEIGKRFSSLEIIDCIESGDHPGWVCVCDCGNLLVTRSSLLRNGSLTCCRECRKPVRRTIH